MNKYVSPIIEIEYVELKDIICQSPDPDAPVLGDDELPILPVVGGSDVIIPITFDEYFNA